MAWRGADHVGSMVWSLFPITCSHDDVFLDVFTRLSCASGRYLANP